MMHKEVVKLGGTISFVQQTPWIQNMTIRDNILFGLPLDEQRYNKTIQICQLESDLGILKGGDLTEIGEKGINLSGGQKARISLARAVYADKDIVLMDDPISALDSNVKHKVFEEVFCGELRYKTRILVTHAVDFLHKADRIIIMEDGIVKYNGTFNELQYSEEIKHVIETIAKTAIDKEESKKEDSDESNEDNN
jgi:ABC-type multidrug transport system fused ATPase/permease subunit